MLISAGIGIIFCPGCQGGGPRKVDIDGLEPSVQRLVKISEAGEDKGQEFLQALRECISNRADSDRDLLNWHGNGGQSFGEGEAKAIKVDGRSLVTVILWPTKLNISGDFPLRLLLLSNDGSILDQVDCFGDALYVHLNAAVIESSAGGSAAAYVSARTAVKSWEGSLFALHGGERLEIPFPPAGREKKAADAGTFLKIAITKDRFGVPEILR